METNWIVVKIGTVTAAVGGFLLAQLGGWDKMLYVLLSFMLTDIILRALLRFFGKMNLRQCGELNNGTCAKGLVKKVAIILCIFVASVLDTFLGNEFVRDSVIVAFSFTEFLSIIENLKDLGVPVPPVFKKVVTILENKTEIKEKEKGDKK